jgi:hypothetical protein
MARTPKNEDAARIGASSVVKFLGSLALLLCIGSIEAFLVYLPDRAKFFRVIPVRLHKVEPAVTLAA